MTANQLLPMQPLLLQGFYMTTPQPPSPSSPQPLLSIATMYPTILDTNQWHFHFYKVSSNKTHKLTQMSTKFTCKPCQMEWLWRIAYTHKKHYKSVVNVEITCNTNEWMLSDGIRCHNWCNAIFICYVIFSIQFQIYDTSSKFYHFITRFNEISVDRYVLYWTIENNVSVLW